MGVIMRIVKDGGGEGEEEGGECIAKESPLVITVSTIFPRILPLGCFLKKGLARLVLVMQVMSKGNSEEAQRPPTLSFLLTGVEEDGEEKSAVVWVRVRGVNPEVEGVMGVRIRMM